MAKKRVTLPKDLEEVFKQGDIEEIKTLLSKCEINARTRDFAKKPALSFYDCPDEISQWLVEQGADIEATDTWGKTPLHNRCGSMRASIDLLFELGANPNTRANNGNTALHSASDGYYLVDVKKIVENGVEVDAVNKDDLTALEFSLQRCANSDIENMADIAEYLLNIGSRKSDIAKEFVHKIGERFEFHRGGFNSDSVDPASEALERLYTLFDVPPVPRRVVYDGKSPIIAKSKTWQKQHRELWELLVPSSGQALTVQGEVIRITGRISDELYRNGGANWDKNYTLMAQSLLNMLQHENSLEDLDIQEATSMVRKVKSDGSSSKLAELAVKWVNKNPSPLSLEPQSYSR